MSRGSQFTIEHWEAHLWHIICGKWAERRCRVCAIKNLTRGIPAQWDQKPQ